MRINRPNYYLSILIYFGMLINIGCKKECTTKDSIIENKLSPQILSFFRYDSFDTITCKIKNQANIIIQSDEKADGFNTSKEYENQNCGTGTIYNNHYRVVNYYDNTKKLILRTQLKNNKNQFLEIDFDFYNTTIDQNYEIGISSKWIPDTATVDGNFYSDLYSIYNENRNFKLYYSKSFGLIKIISNDETIFQLVN
jgi:hypothetical protein